ncbi:MAG TPA: class I SAM-dependent methyltransferase [Vicinamibacterales bacterium]|jgi:2-polyprenyl-3-methyl-5-hydroxy-6-metoxy-1,4-benzoquinol methylase|nr:class I SAM-dependent methyltransferase [Vicinamibacterales bacterium]
MPLVPSSEQTPCVLCHSDDIEELSRRARDLRSFRTTICRRCGLVWANPPPRQQAMREYYSEEYRRDYKGTASRTLPQIYHAGRGALARYQRIRHLLRVGDKVLDVGCGGGELVYLLRRLGFEATGIDPDRSYSEAARSNLGVPVQTGFIQDLDFPEGLFRVILMYHVLEHVDRPLEILGRLRRWLADDGVLIVEVPNIEARLEAPITRFHVAHLFYYSPDTLAAMATAAGLAVRDISLAADGGTITGLFGPTTQSSFVPSSATYQRTKGILKRHTNVWYYLSPTPYTRIGGRLTAYLRKQLVASRHTNGKQVLDGLFRDVQRS